MSFYWRLFNQHLTKRICIHFTWSTLRRLIVKSVNLPLLRRGAKTIWLYIRLPLSCFQINGPAVSKPITQTNITVHQYTLCIRIHIMYPIEVYNEKPLVIVATEKKTSQPTHHCSEYVISAPSVTFDDTKNHLLWSLSQPNPTRRRGTSSMTFQERTLICLLSKWSFWANYI